MNASGQYYGQPDNSTVEFKDHNKILDCMKVEHCNVF